MAKKSIIKKSVKSTSVKRARYSDEMRITLKAKENPFREKSSRAVSFSKLRSGVTVGKAIASRILSRGRVRYFARRGVIAVA